MMNCEEFWGKIPEYIANKEELPNELKQHIAICNQCEKEFRLLSKGLINLKNELKQDMPAVFWHDMRDAIGKEIKVPRKIWLFSDLWRFVLIPAGLTAALFLGIFFHKQDNKAVFYPYETALMVSEVSLEDMVLQNNIPIANDKFDPEFNAAIFCGITDEMAIVIIKNNDIS